MATLDPTAKYTGDEEMISETVPLFGSHASQTTLADALHTPDTLSELPLNDEVEVSRWDLIVQEATWLLSSSVPLVLSYLCQSSFTFASMLSVGKLGVNELAAASLAVMLVNVIVLMPSIGMACALETFCSAAFTASSDKTRVGFHLQRGLIAVTIQLIPTILGFVFIDRLLVLTGQTEEVAALCAQFLRIWLLGSWPQLAFECLKRFVQAQGIMQASTWVMVVVAPLHLLNSYILVWSPVLGMGFVGAPWAIVISNWMQFAGLVAFIAFGKARQAWGGFALRECFDGILEFYKLALPSAAMLGCSWVAFELVTFESSAFGPVALAAQACMFTAMSITYQAPSAIGAAASARIGNSLGQGKQRRARYAAYTAISFGYIVGMTCSVVLFLNRRKWGYIFSDNVEVVTLCAALMPYFAAVSTYDGMNGLVAGILRALGKQGLGALLAFPSFWVLAIPLGSFLAFGAPHMEIAGLWLGLVLGVVAYSLSQQCYILFYVDWRHEVKVCLDRLVRTSPSSYFDEPAAGVHDSSIPCAYQHQDRRRSCYGSLD
ncbi:ethionine resistance protein [Coemansia sp. RSA 1813]|nr:ethionine resistance protein [Coemansia sp. RSA 1646]KAJ1769968.1 ethionine resistance protein [Coemansia sp. RSA 1843]KAJ2087879.1 ethionine resistance protein [Coemansia sp. RSA 986]KAJ2212772.1 ethionine resistance protein [Coemansia sp. RSA 487]KAJ2567511.1 ethionine resistance protein [Coemansia sp. RSA 1813]